MTLKKLRLNILIFLGLITCLSLLLNCDLTQSTVKAQVESLVRIEPESISIIKNSTTTVDVQVIDGANINAFDLKITYDAEILLLESWSLGNYLSNLAQVIKEQTPGSLRLVYTQLATPPVSGDGVLLRLVFKGVAVGSSAITFGSVSFADPDGNLMNPETKNGMIIVQSNVGPTVTSTITPTFTITPTQTKTQIPSPTVTGTLPTPSATLTGTLPTVTLTDTPETTETITEQVSSTETQGPDNNGLVSETALATSTPQYEVNFPIIGMDETQTDPVFQKTSEDSEDKMEIISIFLWALLIIFSLSIVIMIFILIKRKKTEHLKEW